DRRQINCVSTQCDRGFVCREKRRAVRHYLHGPSVQRRRENAAVSRSAHARQYRALGLIGNGGTGCRAASQKRNNRNLRSMAPSSHRRLRRLATQFFPTDGKLMAIEVSHSRVQTYERCPWMYHLVYNEGWRAGPKAPAALGQSLHRALADFLAPDNTD